MSRGLPLLLISVGLDLLGLMTAAFLVGLPVAAVAFGVLFFLLAWFLGGYSFLSWPWIPYERIAQRWILVVASTVFLAAWLDPDELVFIGLFLAIWGLALRRLLQPQARRQASLTLARSPIVRREARSRSRTESNAGSTPRQLLLLIVAYHPSPLEVEQLQGCLAELPEEVGYAVVVNDYQPGEAVDKLADRAEYFLTNSDNPGYGRAVNRLVLRLEQLPPYIGVLNTDLSWSRGTFEQLLAWLQHHPKVSLAVPQILDESGSAQNLCKRNPTVLGLLSRRFIPSWLKPAWLRRYDAWYVMADEDYQEVFEASYLSGCCMLMRSDAFRRVGGFDESYFLYLEDADLTRTLAREGLCVHLPVAGVVHGWGRGNYRNVGLMAVNLASAWHYFRKWGWALW